MFDFHQNLLAFHNTHVRLSKTQQDEMRDKRKVNLKRIREGLEENGKPAFAEDIKQGGYKHKTMVQPPEVNPDLQYDIDNAIVFEASDADVTPATTRKWVRDAISKKGKGFGTAPTSKSKCVRVSYADGKQCDFPVLRRTENWLFPGYTYELAAGDEWVERDSTEISDWVDERVSSLSPDEKGSSQLRRIIRLVKCFGKTHAFTNRHSFPSGIVITALAIEHYVPRAKRDDISFRETMRAISQSAATPVYASSECVSDSRDEDRIPRLREQASKTVEVLDALDDKNMNENDAMKAWKKVFKHSFFEPKQSAKVASAALGLGVAGLGSASDERVERHKQARLSASGVIPPFAIGGE